ncbi:MAG TPA: GFA family protein [Polyangiales bacterium]|nr:GFA family protein [Polyangiales bacterium]
MLEGGCYCGWIRYEAHAAPFNETNCHCSICRRTTGGTYVSWFSVPKGEFKILTGHPGRYDSSETGSRTFCPRCGTQLTFEDARFPDEIDVTTTSLDAPEKVPPRDHTRVSAKLAWVELDDGLPQFREAREQESENES